MNFDFIRTQLKIWYDEHVPEMSFPNEATKAFLLAKLRSLFETDLLEKKMQQELCGQVPFRPLGNFLVIISEKDVLGALYALLALYLTGNRATIKARQQKKRLESLRTLLQMDPTDLVIEDWDSIQGMPEAFLKDVNGILLAGGETLIRAFRSLAGVGVRLIEFGPKISFACVQGDDFSVELLEEMVQKIIFEVTLFNQEVCSSPQFILFESLETAQRCFSEVSKHLQDCEALEYSIRLEQMTCYQTLQYTSKLHPKLLQVAFCAETGWGITLCSSSDLREDWRFLRGFHFIVGDLKYLLPQFSKKYFNQLQTLGHFGVSLELLAEDFGFTRICPLGEMHDRLFLDSHDGIFELPQFVKYLSLSSR